VLAAARKLFFKAPNLSAAQVFSHFRGKEKCSKSWAVGKPCVTQFPLRGPRDGPGLLIHHWKRWQCGRGTICFRGPGGPVPAMRTRPFHFGGPFGQEPNWLRFPYFLALRNFVPWLAWRNLVPRSAPGRVFFMELSKRPFRRSPAPPPFVIPMAPWALEFSPGREDRRLGHLFFHFPSFAGCSSVLRAILPLNLVPCCFGPSTARGRFLQNFWDDHSAISFSCFFLWRRPALVSTGHMGGGE